MSKLESESPSPSNCLSSLFSISAPFACCDGKATAWSILKGRFLCFLRARSMAMSPSLTRRGIG